MISLSAKQISLDSPFKVAVQLGDEGTCSKAGGGGGGGGRVKKGSVLFFLPKKKSF
jgi:hypothetical protein